MEITFEGTSYEVLVQPTLHTNSIYGDHYKATGADSYGNVYNIVWEINHPDFENLEDEADACDWDNPIAVERESSVTPKPFTTSREEMIQHRYDVDAFIRGSRADNFTSLIITAAVKADRRNLYKLSMAFPDIIATLGEAIGDDRFMEHITIED